MSDLPSFDGILEAGLSSLLQLKRLLSLRGEDWATELNQLDLLLRGVQASIEPRSVESSTRRSVEDVQGLPECVLQDRGISIVQSGDIPLQHDVAPEEKSEELSDRFYDFGATYRALQPVTARQEAQMSLLERETESLGMQGSFASLTQEEMRQLFQAALSDARKGQQGARWVLASMATGRSIAELSMASREAGAGCTWLVEEGGIAFAPDVRFMAHPEKGGFALYPPKELSNWLHFDGEGESPKQAAENWLHRQKHGRTHRLSRIERALEDALLSLGADRALAALLSGRSARAVIQLYYARFPVISLREFWLKALAECFGNCEGFRLEPLDPKRHTIGSLVVPDIKEVAQWFSGLFDAAELARARRVENISHRVDLVAAEANLAASILCFQTARRPHREAFEPLSQFTGRRRPMVRLGGKGGRSVDDGRWLPLAAASQKALERWMKVLEDLETSRLAIAHRGLGEMISALRAGKVPLFFQWPYLDDQPQTLMARDLFFRVGAPALSEDRARDRQTVSIENWARHFMRAALFEENVPGKLIDSYMGHGGAAFDPMAPASGFAIADQDILRQAIDRIWEKIEHHMAKVKVS